MFADDRVPQILRHLGVLEYSSELASLIDNESELAFSSRWELELRASTIIAVDLIMAEIKQSGSP